MAGEAHVPWELARFPDPLPDPSLPPFLSAQFAMARWILSPNVAPMPSATHAIDHIAVVTGQYSRFGRMQDLPFANAERQFLMASYVEEAIPLRADDEELSQLMTGKVQIENGATCGAELVHFALHGDVTADTPPVAVLYLSDGKTFSSTMFLDSGLAKGSKPFLFLNACKAGAPVTQLGDYAGFAGDRLRAGFTAMLAPLWSVEDDLAHEVAKDFYQTALPPNGASKRVGEVMTAIRAKYGSAPELGRHSTYMAYVFYGHPNLLLSRT
jgi:CHAT domain-containing protein